MASCGAVAPIRLFLRKINGITGHFFHIKRGSAYLWKIMRRVLKRKWSHIYLHTFCKINYSYQVILKFMQFFKNFTHNGFKWRKWWTIRTRVIRYNRACSSYECFILRAVRLFNKLLGQGYVKERLKSSLRKFYGRYGDLTKQYEVPLSGMLHDSLHW